MLGLAGRADAAPAQDSGDGIVALAAQQRVPLRRVELHHGPAGPRLSAHHHPHRRGPGGRGVHRPQVPPVDPPGRLAARPPGGGARGRGVRGVSALRAATGEHAGPDADRPGGLRPATGSGHPRGGPLVAVLSTAIPIASSVVVGTMIPTDQMGNIAVTGAVLVIISGAAFLLTVAQGLLFQQLLSRASVRATAALWDRVLFLDARFFRRFTAGAPRCSPSTGCGTWARSWCPGSHRVPGRAGRRRTHDLLQSEFRWHHRRRPRHHHDVRRHRRPPPRTRPGRADHDRQPAQWAAARTAGGHRQGPRLRGRQPGVHAVGAWVRPAAVHGRADRLGPGAPGGHGRHAGPGAHRHRRPCLRRRRVQRPRRLRGHLDRGRTGGRGVGPAGPAGHHGVPGRAAARQCPADPRGGPGAAHQRHRPGGPSRAPSSSPESSSDTSRTSRCCAGSLPRSQGSSSRSWAAPAAASPPCCACCWGSRPPARAASSSTAGRCRPWTCARCAGRWAWCCSRARCRPGPSRWSSRAPAGPRTRRSGPRCAPPDSRMTCGPCRWG